MTESARRRGGARARRAQARRAAARRALAPGAEPAPHEEAENTARRGEGRMLVIACGALARDIILLKEQLELRTLDVHCLPAIWHNTPQHIPQGVRARIQQAKQQGYARIFVAYGDCGTGGALDEVLKQEGVQRLPGAHCYAFFSGNEQFLAQLEQDARAYYLTDYLVRHFDTLIWRGLMLDTHPELLSDYFGNYEKLVHLAQTDDAELEAKARQAARRLGLPYERRLVGFGDLKTALEKWGRETPPPAPDSASG